jgi:hypothetical protein
MPSFYEPPKVSDGLQAFLDDPKAVKRHNGHNYADFIAFYSNRKHSLKDCMDYMGILTYNTMNNWIKQYESELSDVS